MSDALFESFHFLKHKVVGKWRHGVHSPLVYQLTSEILRKDRTFEDFNFLDAKRKELLSNNTWLHVEDFGAGSRNNASTERSIKSIAKHALAPKIQAEAIYKLVHFFQPKSIIEFGTSLGLTSLYISRAAQKSEITTIEGSPKIAAFAQEFLRQNNALNVQVIHQKFDDYLVSTLPANKTFDLIYIDGNHTYEATTKYFLKMLEHTNQDAWFILDDIYWSRDMSKAWNQIIGHHRVSLSMDFFHFGVVMLQPRMTKEHFKLNGLLSF